MRNFTCDFGTYAFNGKDKKTDVWLTNFYDVDTKENVTGYSIQDFIEQTMEHPTGNFFFQGLASTYSHFIIKYLKKQGYEMIGRKHAMTKPNLIVGDNRSFTVYHYLGDDKGYVIHNYFDSLFFLRGSLTTIGKSFGIKRTLLPVVRYGEQHEVTITDRKCIENNCYILAKALKKGYFIEAFENRIRSISQYATQTMFYEKDLELERIPEFEPVNAYKGYKGTYRIKRFVKWRRQTETVSIPKEWEIKGEPRTKEELQNLKKRRDKIEEDLAKGVYSDKITVLLKSKELNRIKNAIYIRTVQGWKDQRNKRSRKAYRTGYYYINEKHRDEWIDKLGVTIDCNSIYSYCYSSKKLPKNIVGTVKTLKEFNKKYGSDYLYMVKVSNIRATVKRGKVPTITLRSDDELNITSVNEYQKSIEASKHINYKEIHLTQPDFEYLIKNYNIATMKTKFYVFDIDYELMEKAEKYAHKFYEAKAVFRENGKLFEEFQAKMMLNSITGYWGYRKQDSVLSSFVCVSAFLTAYGRSMTAEFINKINSNYFCYAAVDAIHTIIPETCLDGDNINFNKLNDWFNSIGIVIGKGMGEWKVERVWKRAKYIHVNCYGELDIQGKWHSFVSGFKGKMPMKRFERGEVFTHDMTQEVDGGTVLMPTKFELW